MDAEAKECREAVCAGRLTQDVAHGVGIDAERLSWQLRLIRGHVLVLRVHIQGSLGPSETGRFWTTLRMRIGPGCAVWLTDGWVKMYGDPHWKVIAEGTFLGTVVWTDKPRGLKRLVIER